MRIIKNSGIFKKNKNKDMNKRNLLFCALMFIALFGVCLVLNPNNVYASESRAPEVKIFDTSNKHLNAAFLAYDEGFRGGGNVAVGDVDGDGNDEIIVGAGPGGGPHVRVFDNYGNFTGFSIFPFHVDYRGGVDVAAGDVDGDGVDEIIVSQASNGQAWVKVYEANAQKTILAEFIAYAPNFEGGAHVASGDINGDGLDEIITGSGMSSTSHVRSFNGKGEFTGLSLFPFEESYRGGVDVAVGNVDGGREYEVIMSKNAFDVAQVKVYKSDSSKRILGDFLAFPADHREGGNVASGDIDRDGEDEVIVGANGNGPHVRTFEAWGYVKTFDIKPYEEDFRGGVKVAVGNVDSSSTIELVTMPGRRVWQGRRGIYKYIEVDLSEQKLEAYRAGRKENEFLISSGISRYPTPIGDFNIWLKLLSDRMTGTYGPNHPDNYDIPNVPYVMYFNGGYALHGAFWHNNFGHPMSHGCVNISVPNSAWLYQWSSLGDPVFVRP